MNIEYLLIFFIIISIVFIIMFLTRVYGWYWCSKKKYATHTTYSDEFISNLLKTKRDTLPNSGSLFKGEKEAEDYKKYLEFMEMDFFKEIFSK